MLDKKKLSGGMITGIVVAVVVALMLMMGIGSYNSLVGARENLDESWAVVESKLQLRQDTIPNLVNAVKGSMKQEEKIFTAIADARTGYTNAKTTNEKVEALQQEEQAVNTLVSVINESYPDLKSMDNVTNLMDTIAGTENKISTQRDRYSQEAKNYNTKIKKFPKSIFASMFGFEKAEYFAADKGAEKAPVVDLTTD